MAGGKIGKLTRRQAIAVGALGATGAAALAVASGDGSSAKVPVADGNRGGGRTVNVASKSRLPVVFLPHGGGPWPFADLGFGNEGLPELTRYLESVATLPKEPPKALLVVSAHWEEKVPTVMTHPSPPMLFDYYGFPPETYELTWPAPGNPSLAARTCELLDRAGIPSAADAARGFDHGTFVPLKLTYPKAEIPTIQLSLKAGLDPAEHLAIGRAIAPLRDEGVFILGSGMSFHNLRAFRDPRAFGISKEFDDWLHDTAVREAADRDARLTAWASAPSARMAHPREEHLIPLMVIAGAAGADRGRIAYGDKAFGVRLTGLHFG
ncbi:MAG: class III extradiol ring-cleavage dioxygenase [Polyangiaceae bacterium]